MPTRKSYAGAAVPTTIASGALGIGANTFTLTLATGWPTTTNGPFVATIDRGAATEEHVLVASRSGLVCSSVTRGYAQSSEVAHGPNAPIEHRWDAVSADEANRIASLLTTKGDTFGHDGTQPQRVAVGATAGQALLVNPAAATGQAFAQPLSDLITTKGDTLAASGAAAIVRVPGGTEGQVYTRRAAAASGVAWDDLGVPTGAISMFGAAAAPTGWLLCDGAAVSRSTYAALFALVGTLYGVGNGSTTFNVPNLKGRIPIGYDAGTSPYNVLGNVGGAATATIASANLPTHTHVMDHDHGAATSAAGSSHSHGITDPTHNHTQNGHQHASNDQSLLTFVGSAANSTIYTNAGANIDHSPAYNIVTSGFTASQTAVNQAAATGVTTQAEAAHTHSVDLPNFTGSTGNGAFANTALSILNPYIVLNFIIKI